MNKAPDTVSYTHLDVYKRQGLDRLKSKPMGTISISPLSPLNFPADIAEAIVDCAELGLPLTMLPCPTRGLTAPLTLIGGLVQQNAEQLAFLTLARLVNRSCPLVYTCRLAAANMRTGFVGGKDPDLGLSGACVAQIARYYGLPSGVYGMDTGASLPDIQSGYERAINCLPPVLARATMVSGFGLLNGGLLASAEEMVIDNEIYGMLMHRLGGDLTVNEEIIGVEVVKACLLYTSLGLPFDRAASYRKGAARAPDRIRSISTHIPPTTEEGRLLTALKLRDLGNLCLLYTS